jgi:nucleoside-diphosphate-sugar epimerase
MPVPDLHGLGGRHIFLTGGTGAVGRTLIDYLDQCRPANDTFHVTVLTRDAAGFAARHPMQAARPWLTLVKGDLGALPTLPVGVTDVVHAAADTHVGQGRVAWIDQIVGGTRALLDASRAAGVNRFLLVSSGAVYGPQPPSVPRLREDYIGAPDTLLAGSTYGQAKRVAEQLCTVFHAEYGLSTVIARLFAFGSVHIPRDGRYALGSFIRDALSDDDAPIRIAGDGTAVRSYLNGHDMAHALVTALCMGAPGQAYNVGSQAPVTIAELARRVRDRLSPGRDVKILGTAGDGQRSIYVPDVTGIAALGAASQTDLDAVIDDAAGRSIACA